MNKESSSIRWSYLQHGGNQVIAFVSSIILARLIDPSDFGLMGMIYIVFTISNVLVNSGLGTSLLRSKNASEEDFSTIFYFNIIVGLIAYICIFLLSPVIASFYDSPVLVDLIKIQGITVILTSLFLIQKTKFQRDLDIKSDTKVMFISNLLSSLSGICLAFYGFGVWSIVYMSIVNCSVSLALYWYFSKWVPSSGLSLVRLKSHLSFGYKLTLVSLMDAFFANFYHIIIGKMFKPEILGFYSRGYAMRNTLVFSISTPLKQVLLPILANKNSSEETKDYYQKVLSAVLLIMIPILLFFSLFAEDIFVILFTETWLPSVVFFQLICLSSLFYPLNTFIYSFLSLKGLSNVILRIDILKKLLLLVVVAVTFRYKDPIILVSSQLIIAAVEVFLNIYLNKQYLRFSVYRQFRAYTKLLIGPLISIFLTHFIVLMCLPEVVVDNRMLKILIALSVFSGLCFIQLKYVFGSEFKFLKNMIR